MDILLIWIYYIHFYRLEAPVFTGADEGIILRMSPSPWIIGGIVLLTFIGIAIGRYPMIKSHRTTIALMGVALLLLTGQVAFENLPAYIDFNTIILLFSMMIINANLKLAGFFNLTSRWLMKGSGSP